MNAIVSEQEIGLIVEHFYEKVRLDSEIGPIFNATVGDWPYHLRTLKDFWSTILLASGRYKGDPMMTHLPLALDPQHFERWLTLFSETAREFLPEERAVIVVTKAERLAQNFRLGIARRKQSALDN